MIVKLIESNHYSQHHLMVAQFQAVDGIGTALSIPEVRQA
jgi:hypothetical protein